MRFPIRVFSRSVSSEGSSSYDHEGTPSCLLSFSELYISAQVGLLRTGNKEQIPLWDTTSSPLRSSPRQRFIDSAFKMYTDPETSKEIPIDRQILRRHVLVVELIPGKVITLMEKIQKNLQPQRSLKKPFVMMSIYISSEFGTHLFCNSSSPLTPWCLRDTVSSVGAFRNKYYPGAERAENICFFRHALALDERRVKFIPEYIFAKEEFFSAGEFNRPRCKEVWFRGSHSDVWVPTCFWVADKCRLANSGGGNVKNKTSDNGAIPSRWMAYEAMLAGLEMTPFQDGIRVKDLEPKIGKESMTRLYTPLEYVFFFKWEDHSEDRPPLLESPPPLPPRTGENPRSADDFSRSVLASFLSCLSYL